MNLACVWMGLQQDGLLIASAVRYMSTANKFIPRITIPQKMVLNINKQNIRNERSKRIKKPLKFKSPLVISCHREKFNHHKGQTYSNFNPKTLASYGWKHRKSVGDHFTLMDWNSNPAVVTKPKSFEDLNIMSSLRDYLSEAGLSTPTDVQIQAIPEILQGNNVICAAETGSGKTLAYLLPTFQLIKQYNDIVTNSKHKNSPKSIIIVPSRELAIQIMSVIKDLTKIMPLKPQLVLGKVGSMEKLVMNNNMDILVTTSGALRAMLTKHRIKFHNLMQVVLDEADTLLDDSFQSDIFSILNHMKAHIKTMSPADLNAAVSSSSSSEHSAISMSGTQIILASATLPTSLNEKIGNIIPLDTFTRVTTEYLHHIPPHIKQKFVRLLPSEKPGFVLKFAKKNKKSSVILFCKDNSSSYWLHKFLEENGVSAALFNGNIDAEERKYVYEKFMNQDFNILVSTDIASRGLDTTHVQTVMNYDFPHFVSDYLHRVGRVGRLGSNSTSEVISLVAHKYEVEIVWLLEMAARKMTQIHNVNANIKRKHVGRHSQTKRK